MKPRKGSPQSAPVKLKRGRKKEKVQISVRIDQAVMARAYQRIKRTGERITDLMERGMMLAMREDESLPLEAMRGRFLMAQAKAEEQRSLERHFAMLRFGQVRPLSANERHIQEVALKSIAQCERWDGYEDALATYGPSPGAQDLERALEG